MAPSAIETLSNVPVIANYELSKPTARSDGARAGSELVHRTLLQRAKSINPDHCEPGDEDAFFVADLGEVYRQYVLWKQLLPEVKPFYAVKCNPDNTVMQLLAALGVGFDCASKGEIDQALALGVEPTSIIYAQPCKTASYLRHAAARHVQQMTFDNADELHKIAAHFPAAELYLRLRTDDANSVSPLSLKFGAAPADAAALLALAARLGLRVVGVSFHIGSGAADPAAFHRAVADARRVFDQAADAGFALHTLDVGGGFSRATFPAMAAALRAALAAARFPPGTRLIAEPGRLFVAHAYTLAATVIARRTLAPDPAAPTRARAMLYLNDGVYGNFANIIFEGYTPRPTVLLARSPRPDAAPPAEYSLWGPTCDSVDCIAAAALLPPGLAVGDWLCFPEMGAYSRCCATRFNGFSDRHDVLYVCSEPGAAAILGMTGAMP